MLIAQITDLHLRPVGKPAYRIAETSMLAERAFRAISRLDPAPDAVIVTGDLTDCGLVEEYELLGELIARWLPMPVYLIPGNHDRRENLKAVLGHLPGIGEDPDFVHYTVDDHPVRMIMLDSVVPGHGHGELCPRRLDFLKAALAAAPDKPTLIAVHHPPIVTGVQHMDRINLWSRAAMADIVSGHDNVMAVVCGHDHRPIVSRFAGTVVQVVPGVAHQVVLDFRPHGPAHFVMEPAAFALHRWSEVEGLVSHGAYVEDYPGPFPFVADPDYPGKAE